MVTSDAPTSSDFRREDNEDIGENQKGKRVSSLERYGHSRNGVDLRLSAAKEKWEGELLWGAVNQFGDASR